MAELPDLFIEERKRTVYWQDLYYSLTDSMKNNRWVKNSYKHSFMELREILLKGKYWCDDCGKEIDMQIPKTFEELADKICYFFNENICSQCYECEIKMIESGQVLGTSNEGWYPNKDELLKKVKEEHSKLEQVTKREE